LFKKQARLFDGKPVANPNTKAFRSFNPPNASSEFWAQDSVVGGFVSQAAYRGEPNINGGRGQVSLFEVNSIPEHNDPTEGQSRFGTVPSDEFVNGMTV
jgi:hypothetical protein